MFKNEKNKVEEIDSKIILKKFHDCMIVFAFSWIRREDLELGIIVVFSVFYY